MSGNKNDIISNFSNHTIGISEDTLSHFSDSPLLCSQYDITTKFDWIMTRIIEKDEKRYIYNIIKVKKLKISQSFWKYYQTRAQVNCFISLDLVKKIHYLFQSIQKMNFQRV